MDRQILPSDLVEGKRVTRALAQRLNSESSVGSRDGSKSRPTSPRKRRGRGRPRKTRGTSRLDSGGRHHSLQPQNTTESEGYTYDYNPETLELTSQFQTAHNTEVEGSEDDNCGRPHISQKTPRASIGSDDGELFRPVATGTAELTSTPQGPGEIESVLLEVSSRLNSNLSHLNDGMADHSNSTQHVTITESAAVDHSHTLQHTMSTSTSVDPGQTGPYMSLSTLTGTRQIEPPVFSNTCHTI